MTFARPDHRPPPPQKKPYTMLKESSEELEGNDRYEGICVDLIEELSKALQFNYTIRLTPDNAPGKYDEQNGTWNGMIGELLEGRADLAIADLTITFEREAVVDFTMQFMNLGQSSVGPRTFITDQSLYSMTVVQSDGHRGRRGAKWMDFYTAFVERRSGVSQNILTNKSNTHEDEPHND